MQNLISFFQIKKESNRSKSSQKTWFPILKKQKNVSMQTSFKFKIALRSTNSVIFNKQKYCEEL